MMNVALKKDILPIDYLKVLWRICVPLMLSAFSSTLMIFLNRIVLARYQTETMIAATTAANVFLIFQFGSMSIAMIAEVFVGQFNGAKQWDKVGGAVWQMIWFSLGCVMITLPIGLFFSSYLIPSEFAKEGEPYLKWIMFFAPCFPLVSALSAFFIGRNQVKTVVLSVIIGNLLNLMLVFPLVFGIPGILAAQGAKGAAIATGIAELAVAVGLFSIFINARHRHIYHTHRFQFNKRLFWQSIKMGLPNATGHVLAASAWTLMLNMLVNCSLEHAIVMSIGLNIWMLFSFITEGLQKGITAVAANCFGASKKEAVSDILVAGLKLQFVLVVLLALPLVLFPHLFVNLFIPDNAPAVKELVEWSCRWLWVAFLFDGMAWIIDGILTAAGDTAFIMMMNSIGTWMFCFCPIYLFVVKMEGSPILTLQLISLFCFILFASYLLRYKSKRWKNSLRLFFCPAQ